MVQLRVLDDDSELITDDTILSLDKGSDRLEQIGLSLSESKDVLAGLPRPMIEAQLTSIAAVAASIAIVLCFTTVRISFCSVPCLAPKSLTSSRFIRCCRQPGESKTFSPLTALLTEHAAPELLYMETKWASSVSFGVTVDLLKACYRSTRPISRRFAVI